MLLYKALPICSKLIKKMIVNGKKYEKRVDAEIADQKRKEAYLRYVDYQPKIEEKVYRSKEWEGKGDR